MSTIAFYAALSLFPHTSRGIARYKADGLPLRF